MSNEDAGKTVNAERFFRAGENKKRIQDTLPPPDGNDTEGADDHRQPHRHCHQPDDPDPSRKLPLPGECQGHGKTKNDGKKGGERRLINREAQNTQCIRVQNAGSGCTRIKGQKRKHGERHEQENGGKSRRPEND